MDFSIAAKLVIMKKISQLSWDASGLHLNWTVIFSQLNVSQSYSSAQKIVCLFLFFSCLIYFFKVVIFCHSLSDYVVKNVKFVHFDPLAFTSLCPSVFDVHLWNTNYYTLTTKEVLLQVLFLFSYKFKWLVTSTLYSTLQICEILVPL